MTALVLDPSHTRLVNVGVTIDSTGTRLSDSRSSDSSGSPSTSVLELVLRSVQSALSSDPGRAGSSGESSRSRSSGRSDDPNRSGRIDSSRGTPVLEPILRSLNSALVRPGDASPSDSRSDSSVPHSLVVMVMVRVVGVVGTLSGKVRRANSGRGHSSLRSDRRSKGQASLERGSRGGVAMGVLPDETRLSGYNR